MSEGRMLQWTQAQVESNNLKQRAATRKNEAIAVHALGSVQKAWEAYQAVEGAAWKAYLVAENAAWEEVQAKCGEDEG